MPVQPLPPVTIALPPKDLFLVPGEGHHRTSRQRAPRRLARGPRARPLHGREPSSGHRAGQIPGVHVLPGRIARRIPRAGWAFPFGGEGDFCRRLHDILLRHAHGGEVRRSQSRTRYRYNPLHNDLEAYSLAYGIATLTTNLFEEQPLLTVDEAAALLRTTRKAMYAMVERRQVPGVIRIRRRVLLRAADLLHWLDQKCAPSPKE